MKKAFVGLVALIQALIGCTSSSTNHQNHRQPVPYENSKLEEIKIPEAKVYIDERAVGDIMGNQNGKHFGFGEEKEDQTAFEAIPYKTPFFVATKVDFPKNCLQYKPNSNINMLMRRIMKMTEGEDNVPDSAVVLSSDSKEIYSLAIGGLLLDERWQKVQSPEELVGKDNYLVLKLEKGHWVDRCPTSEHVLEEFDNVGLTSVYLVTPSGARTLDIIPQHRTLEPILLSKDYYWYIRGINWQHYDAIKHGESDDSENLGNKALLRSLMTPPSRRLSLYSNHGPTTTQRCR